MTKSKKSRKTSEKKPSISSYKKKLLERQAIINSQKYFNTSKFVSPVGNSHFWNIKEESVFDEIITDPFGIGFDSTEDMSFLPEIP